MFGARCYSVILHILFAKYKNLTREIFTNSGLIYNLSTVPDFKFPNYPICDIK